VPAGPAAKAGIADGDVIVSIDGVSARLLTESDDDAYPRYRYKPVGTVLRVVRQRGAQKSVEVKVTLRDLLP
jgi:C-terminal processing protease CtpA/Prc